MNYHNKQRKLRVRSKNTKESQENYKHEGMEATKEETKRSSQYQQRKKSKKQSTLQPWEEWTYQIICLYLWIFSVLQKTERQKKESDSTHWHPHKKRTEQTILKYSIE